MEMTFSNYIDNPMGKENAVISNREMYRQFYTSKFNALMMRENGKFDFHLYKYQDEYVCHVKVPSEVVKDFYYDVVIQFYTKDKKITDERTLENYYVKFYSNDPAFVYTFVHAFEKNKLFMTDLSSKMSKQALRERADQRNPKDTVGYVKSLYFAYLLMKNKGLFAKIKYVTADKYSPRAIQKEVMDADEKIRLRQEGEEEQRKKEKAKKTQGLLKRRDNDTTTNSSLKVSKTSKVNSIGTIGKIKKSKSVKHI